ncbi:MAG TPA: hypothetical protein VK601_29410 [Kofleriaceae bacterium]|nr:hypothetical protein [Kofleriaceae bacterium]
MPPVRIGTVDIPERTPRERYFQELSYLELSALQAGPLKAGAMARWQELAPSGALGLVVPWVLTHRKPPRAQRLWHHDTTVGDFRDSALGRSALAAFRAAAASVAASHAIFPSPPLFAPSTANRDQLRRFFSEVATPEAVGATRVWIPDGLWEPRAAVAFAGELGVTCAIDPLVYDPNQPAEVYEDLEATALYFRVTGLGRSGPIRSEKLEDLSALLEHYDNIELTVAFASPARWQDARNFKKLLEGAVS